ncbi:hypothetical protein KGY77_10480 [Candidatus Bipolaricaulota bacterium]|nr:hypothetical protein [Candidatus Bipolaricaulota bacterium]MBS3793052.1 hypothetical protein [Candidatus Bipolaricaulota bacterium]
MNPKSRTVYSVLTVFLVMVLTLTAISPGGTAADEIKPIDLYVTPESEDLAIGDLLTHLLEARLSVKVSKKVQYLGVGLKKTARGEGDLFVGLKLPRPDSNIWAKSAHRLCDLGPIYEDVMAGWAVPSYLPEEKLGSLSDLSNPEVRERLYGEIIGYSSEEGLLEKSEAIIKSNKGLNGYKLVKINKMAAISELGRTIRNKEWIVTTIRRPSTPFSIYEVRFIADLTEEQRVHMFGRKDLMAKYPNKVTEFLSRFYLPIDLVNELIFLYDKDKGSAAKKFIDNYPDLVNYWVEGPSSL